MTSMLSTRSAQLLSGGAFVLFLCYLVSAWFTDAESEHDWEGTLTPSDGKVLAVALEDCIDRITYHGSQDSWKRVIVYRSTVGGGAAALSLPNIYEALSPYRVVRDEIDSLVGRNRMVCAVTNLSCESGTVLIDTMSTMPFAEWQSMMSEFSNLYPDAKCGIALWLPGYSRHKDRALVMMRVVPSYHGRTLVYALEWQMGEWSVVARGAYSIGLPDFRGGRRRGHVSTSDK